jgi:GT2 family glycosyltransferase
MGALVFVIIPVHNGIEHTLPTVKSLLPLLPPGGRIVVVDDGSTDGTTETLQEECPAVTVLQGDGNLWWSGAINKGARYALEEGADYVLLLNNDVIIHPQFLEELLQGAREFPGALVGSKILFAHEPLKVWFMGGKINWLRGKYWITGSGQPDTGAWREPIEVDWLAGMSMLVPTAVFRLGLWVDQEAFPQYSGDSDFSIRARKAGFKLIVWPRSHVYNKIHVSGLDSKLLLGSERFTLRRFAEMLTSRKSSVAFCTHGKLILRHAPIWSWPLVFVRFYSYVFLKCFQVWLNLPGFRRSKGRNSIMNGSPHLDFRKEERAV